MDESIRGFLQSHVLFKDYASNTTFIDTLVSNIKTRVFADGTYVIRKGEVGRAMFFVLRGEVEIISEDGETIINILKEQSFFGEIGVLFSIPRTVSCRARGRSILLVLTKESLSAAVAPYPRIAFSIAQIAEERYSSHIKQAKSAVNVDFGEELKVGMTQHDLKSIPLFRDCEIGFLHNLAMSLTPVQYTGDELLIRKGDPASEMFFVVRGVAEVFNESTGQVFAQFHPGSFFGEVGLFFDVKRSASVRCNTPHVNVFKLHKSDLDSILVNYPEVKTKIEEEAAQRFKFIEARAAANLDKSQQMSSDIEVVREKLKAIPIFKDTSTAFLHQLALSAHLKVVYEGEVIIRKGEMGREMFFVLDGAVQVISEDFKIVYAEMLQNSFFGEVALFYEVNRTATVRANTKTALIVISNEALQSVLNQYPLLSVSVHAKADENYQLFLSRQSAVKGRQNDTHEQQFDVETTTQRLKKVPIFERCQEGFLRTLALSTSIRSLKMGDTVVRKNDPSTEMYFIVSGSVEIISADEQQIFDVVKEGSFFGELGVIRGIARTASVRVNTATCDLIILSAEAMRKALSEYPESFQTLLIEAQKRFQLVEERTTSVEHALIHNSDGTAGSVIGPSIPSSEQTSTMRSNSKQEATGPLPETLIRTSNSRSKGSQSKEFEIQEKDLQPPVEKEKGIKGLGQLFSLHYSRKKRHEKDAKEHKEARDTKGSKESAASTGAKSNNSSQDSIAQPDTVRGMSAHVSKAGTAEESKVSRRTSLSSKTTAATDVATNSSDGPAPGLGSRTSHTSRSFKQAFGKMIVTITGSTAAKSQTDATASAAASASYATSIVDSTSIATTTTSKPAASQEPTIRIETVQSVSKASLQSTSTPAATISPIMPESKSKSASNIDNTGFTSRASIIGKTSDQPTVASQGLITSVVNATKVIRPVIKSILDLDDNQLCIVLSSVPSLNLLRLRAVCRRWNEALLLPHFWTKLNLQAEFRKINRRSLEVLAFLGGETLTRIDISGCWMLIDNDIGSLAMQCPNIRVISVSNCWKLTDIGLAHITRNLKRLMNLNISFCGQVSGIGFADNQLTMLRKINISYCKLITDEHLEKLLAKTPELQDIRMRRCQRVTDFGIFLIVRYCRRLRSLDLRDSDKITDRCLKWIASSCFNLIDLNLAFCSRITNGGLYDLSLGSQTFQRLDFTNCVQITDAGIVFFSEGIKSLRVLSLRQCRKMTDAVAPHLVKTTPKLRLLDITGCPLVTSICKMQIEQRLTNVVVRMDRGPGPRGIIQPGENGKPKAVEVPPHMVFTSGPRHVMYPQQRVARTPSFSSSSASSSGGGKAKMHGSSTMSSEGALNFPKPSSNRRRSSSSVFRD